MRSFGFFTHEKTGDYFIKGNFDKAVDIICGFYVYRRGFWERIALRQLRGPTR